MHVNLGGYHIRDIEFSAAFDIVDTKVGKDLSEAIFAYPNNTYQVLRCAAPGRAGRARHDPRRPGQVPLPDPQESPRPHRRHRQDPQRHQDRCGRQLPAGRLRNGHQVVRRADPRSRLRLRQLPSRSSSPAPNTGASASAERGLPIIGDDIKSQVGATILHRVLTSLFVDRGVRLDRTYQLNFGGNTDFLNMLERERLESKKISKTGAVTSMLPYELDRRQRPRRPQRLRALADRPQVVLHPHGRHHLRRTCRSTWKPSSKSGTRPNSAGVVIDAVRCAKLALDRGISGPIVCPGLLLHEDPAQAVQG